jgi:hypothetical protein
LEYNFKVLFIEKYLEKGVFETKHPLLENGALSGEQAPPF